MASRCFATIGEKERKRNAKCNLKMPLPIWQSGFDRTCSTSKIETNPILSSSRFFWIWIVRFFCASKMHCVYFGLILVHLMLLASVSTSWFHHNVRFDLFMFWNGASSATTVTTTTTTIGIIFKWLFIFQLSLKSLRVLKWLRLIYCLTNEEMDFFLLLLWLPF